jgi:rare lipoprotein A (peptidoglycan hydrolase)
MELKYKEAFKLRGKLGSNQYRTKYCTNWFLRTLIIFITTMAVIYIASLWYEKEQAKPIVSPVPETRAIVRPVLAEEPYLEGMATWYGTGVDECLGCNAKRIMANGQPLDDERKTVACGVGGSCKQFPLGSRVKIINQANGMTVYAVVTDTGGFAKFEDNRILDVSKAVRDSLNMGGMTKVRVY